MICSRTLETSDRSDIGRLFDAKHGEPDLWIEVIALIPDTCGIWDTGKPRNELEGMLCQILKGAHQVLFLLVPEPSQSLEELNLSKYEIVDGEPLHDFKGHLQPLLT